jgi:acetyl-CoA acetyltransferase
MKPARRVFVLGGAHSGFIGKFHPDFIWKGHPDFGKRQNPTIDEHIQRAVIGALEKTGVPASAVQKGAIGNFTGELFVKQGHLGAIVAGVHPDFALKPFSRVEGACASGGLAVLAGVDAISAGYDVFLAAGVEVQTTVNASEGADYLARAAHYATQRSIDPFTFPCLFARRAKAYRQTYKVTDEDMAKLVVKAYDNANKNPNAHMQTVRMTAENAATASDKNPLFLENNEYRDFMKVSDCSQVSDGASAIIMVSEAGLAKLGKKPSDAVELLAYGHATAPLDGLSDPLVMRTAEAAIAEAYRDSGTKPSEMGVAEVHDCFSITEVLLYEALGFAERGHGIDLVRDGSTTLGGRLPVNTGGGLMAFGHPVGATGVKQVLEIMRQQKGQCGDYQMAQRPALGITANIGGDDRTAVVTVLRNSG